ncbi:MAG: DNA repair protein RadC [Parcubacteria group bacterium]|nr:DNA repair protein RadC [Parcubacteria group bacterium]
MSTSLGTDAATRYLNLNEVATYSLRDNSLILDNPDRQYPLRVRDLPDQDKPREKLIANGPNALSTPELLAVVLSVGTKKEEVMAMSYRIIKEYGEKSIASQTDPKLLEKELNVPLVKSCQIVACFELGRRFFQETTGPTAVIRTPKQAFQYFKDMRDLPKEQLRGIYLNSRHRVVHDEVISIGSLTTNIVHPREVFRPALEHSAVAMILAHNHPSGTVKPTESDIEVTKQLVEAGRILGIDLLDHIIITKNKFASVPVDY